MMIIDGWYSFQSNASYIDVVMDLFDHFKSGDTWTNFGDYLITNSSASKRIQRIFDEFENNTIGDTIENIWDMLGNISATSNNQNSNTGRSSGR